MLGEGLWRGGLWKGRGVSGGVWLVSDMREWYGREGLLRGCGMEERDVLHVSV